MRLVNPAPHPGSVSLQRPHVHQRPVDVELHRVHALRGHRSAGCTLELSPHAPPEAAAQLRIGAVREEL